jgi:hypothetical protein
MNAHQRRKHIRQLTRNVLQRNPVFEELLRADIQRQLIEFNALACNAMYVEEKLEKGLSAAKNLSCFMGSVISKPIGFK